MKNKMKIITEKEIEKLRKETNSQGIIIFQFGPVGKAFWTVWAGNTPERDEAMEYLSYQMASVKIPFDSKLFG